MKDARKKEFSQKLLEWWQSNKQDFPWRRTTNPYEILIAEMLLRKTTAKQVKKAYEKFLTSYPKPKELAKASEEDLKKILTPLGMEHKRAKILIRLAKILVEEFNGQIPNSEDKLLSLSGIGKYSANAVLSMAYGYDVPMVDTNAIRVIQRVFSFKSSKKRAHTDPLLWKFAKDLIPEGQGSSFNLALIDFAHKVCLPKNPPCVWCLMIPICDYGKSAKE